MEMQSSLIADSHHLYASPLNVQIVGGFRELLVDVVL